jgi:predicted lipoprotein with Yx(FWY)xxD motif
MTVKRTYTAFALLVIAVALALSACGGSDENAGPAPAASSGSGMTGTVAVTSVDGVGEVLVDTDGAALYSADQEADGEILCVDACASIWLPLTLPAGAAGPTADGDLGDRLGVIERPDGAEQVSFDGEPLYRFAEDPEAGTVTGDGFTDTFAGTEFTWHVASPSGASAGSPATGGIYD